MKGCIFVFNFIKGEAEEIMRQVIYLICLCTFILQGSSCNAQAQNSYPGDYFRSPLEIPLYLSGTFGELRTNHFHSGLDIRTRERTGLPVRACAEGYVERIKVKPYGFGKALYIRHLNGYSTVYAHLSRFNDPIEKFVRKVQYEEKRFSVQLYPNSKKFPVKKGELIGYSGNSGSSTGPHLHFEFRDARTQKPLNPLFFSLPVDDDRTPFVRTFRLYPLDKKSRIKVTFKNGKSKNAAYPQHLDLNLIKASENYIPAYVKDIAVRGKIGIGAEVIDRQDGSGHSLGIYTLKLFAEGDPAFALKMEKFKFRDTRYANAQIDYAEKVKTGKKIYRCYILPGNEFDGYFNSTNRGIIEIKRGETKQMVLKASDYFQNAVRIEFTLNYLEDNPGNFNKPDIDPPEVVLPYKHSNYFETPGIKLNFLDGSFYDTVLFRFDTDSGFQKGYSPLYTVHRSFTPVHKHFSISVKANGIRGRMENKVGLVSLDHRNRESFHTANYNNGWVSTRVREFGRYYVDVDTTAPRIAPVNFYDEKFIGGQKTLRVRIWDNKSGIDDYYPSIDGAWALMEYDAKYSLLIFREVERLKPGKHLFHLIVSDNTGNQNSLKLEIKK